MTIERRDERWKIILDRADKMNALSASLVEALAGAVDEAIDARIPVVILEGRGRNFSAGFDFGGFEDESGADLLHRFVRIEMLLQRIARAPTVTIAFAQGRNFGAGVDLFAVCKQRYAAPGTTFRMPGLAFGIQLGTRRFAAIVGRDVAMRILGGVETFNAEEALRIGFIDAIVLPEQWPSIVGADAPKASALPETSRSMLHRALAEESDDADLADLVRSAARPELKDRIRAYLAAQATARSSPASS